MFPPFLNLFPIGDENRTHPLAWVTLFLIAANIGVYAAFGVASPRYNAAIVPQFGLIPSHPIWFTWITYQFLHGSVLHLAGNMLFLWTVAHKLEETLTRAGFILFYLAGGIAAAAAHVLFFPHSTDPVIGASGSIAAVMGAYLVLFPRNRIKVAYLVWLILYVRWGVWRVRSVWALGAWFAFALAAAVTGHSPGGVANWAHAGGFAFGAAVGAVLLAARIVKAPPAVTEALAQERRGRVAGATLDQLELVRRIERAVREGRTDQVLRQYQALADGRSPAGLAPEIQMAVADRLEQAGRPAQAAAAFERLLILDPTASQAPEAALRAGLLFARTVNHPTKARFYLQRAADTHASPDRAALARETRRLLDLAPPSMS